jgi:hypothetical protein
MTKHHGTQTLGFEGFNGYYGSLQQGYGGFDWSSVSFLNESYWQNVKTNWCDTGFQNVLDGTGLAYTSSPNNSQTYGYFRVENLKQTFNLVSMVAASGWETNQPFQIATYTYKPGVGFVLKEKANTQISVYLSQTAQTINFASLAKPKYFKDVSAVIIRGKTGSYGNTCSYGPNDHTYGYQLAFDDLTVKWNKAGNQKGQFTPEHPLISHSQHHNSPMAHLLGNSQAPHAHVIDGPGVASSHSGQNYHPELMSLTGHDPTGLTGQFHLPAMEHFGS